ncbi:DUF2147 domain-containing protein [uncultured Flavobacterium sp.]|uniref:DUF2147 domain-containing protein n=1 Tax=uncultured Flavobacterium sp. TaxID=165435 RepID=UPI0025D56DE9|nr:DUF2147 domain-containing protein [uncultured Flavobacterium sp.]
MKKIIVYSVLFLMATIQNVSSQTKVLGKWKTIDDDTGAAKSIVEIYESNGKIYGKVLQILEKGKEDKVCEECKGDKKNKPIKGMVIIYGLTKNDDEWDGGKILDPKSGKEYKCVISLENENKLKVRGYVGFSLLGRTQYWTRVKE